MNTKGFTLVEMMVVIVIVGILAATAVPRMTIATHRARAAEGPQILSVISNLQHVFRAERDWFMSFTETNNAAWAVLGLERQPISNFYTFSVTRCGREPSPDNMPANFGLGSTIVFSSGFAAIAELHSPIGNVPAGSFIALNNLDQRHVSGADMNNLMPQWNGLIGEPWCLTPED